MKKEKQNLVVKALDYLSRYSLALSGIFLLVMALSSTYGVGRRYLLHNPEPYSYEVSTILLIWCFVLSMASVQFQERHIRGDFVLSRLPKIAQYVIDQMLAPVLGLMCAVLLTWRAIPGALFSLSLGEVSSSAWKEPIFPVKIMIPIGFGFLLIILVYQVYRGFARLRNQMAGRPGEEVSPGQPPPGASMKEGPDGH